MKPSVTIRFVCTAFLLIGTSLWVGTLSPAWGQHVFTVTSTADAGDADTSDDACTTSGGDCTLVAAIEQANATANVDADTPDRIEFDISGSGPHQIASTYLPNVTEAVVIDGTTEPDYSGQPVVEIQAMLNVTGGNSTIRGLAVLGLTLKNNGENTVQACYVGLAADGTAAGNNVAGVTVEQVSDNLIGGPDAEDRNVISGNEGGGIRIEGKYYASDGAADNNMVQNNYIGTTPDGTAALLNDDTGVVITGEVLDNVVRDNLIAGNDGNGISVEGSISLSRFPTGTVIQGNRIGTTPDGLSELRNWGDGIYLEYTTNTTVGGTSTGQRNLISGNGSRGLVIAGGSDIDVQGNYIGVAADGTTALGNGQSGNGAERGVVVRYGASNVTIGGLGAGEGNVISANEQEGIALSGAASNSDGESGVDNIAIQGNYIGTTAAGGAALGNGQSGIVMDVADGTRIEQNVISANAQSYSGAGCLAGIYIQRSADVIVHGNKIGTDATGTTALPNNCEGLFADQQTERLVVGGTNAGEGNLISGNDGAGVAINGSNSVVQGNRIGTDASGAQPLPNQWAGVRLWKEDHHLIGGTSAGAANTIAFNGTDGIVLVDALDGGSVRQYSVNTGIMRNRIFGNDSLAIDLGGDVGSNPGSGLGEGLTENDADDADDGANRYQNFPMFTDADYDSTSNELTVDYHVPASTADAAYPLTVEFFRADTSKYAQGARYLGTETIPSGEAGAARTFTFTPEATMTPRDFVVATVVAADSNTSETNPLRQQHSFSVEQDDVLSQELGYVGVRLNALEASHTSASPQPIDVALWRSNGDPATLPANTRLAMGGSWTMGVDPSVAVDSVTTDVCFDLDNVRIPGEQMDPARLSVYRRLSTSDAWTAQPTALYPDASNPTFACAGAQKYVEPDTTRSEYVVALPLDEAKTFASGDPDPFDFTTLDLWLDFGSLDRTLGVTVQRSYDDPTGGPPSGEELALSGSWTLATDDPDAGFTAAVCLDLNDLTAPRSDIDFAQLNVYKRATSSDPWTALTTDLRPDASDPDRICATGLTAFSEFVVAAPPDALPVELTRFEALRKEQRVALTWTTQSETNNAGFAVERKPKGGTAWTEIAFVEGAGTTTMPQTYRFTDATVPFEAPAVAYRLKQIDVSGTISYSREVEVRMNAPDRFALHPNFPNPFRGQTTLRYALPRAGAVRLAVYDVLGRRVATLVDERQPAGRKQVTFDAGRLTSGTYFVRLVAGDFVATQKIVLVR